MWKNAYISKNVYTVKTEIFNKNLNQQKIS